jgi:hypothetical protein
MPSPVPGLAHFKHPLRLRARIKVDPLFIKLVQAKRTADRTRSRRELNAFQPVDVGRWHCAKHVAHVLRAEQVYVPSSRVPTGDSRHDPCASLVAPVKCERVAIRRPCPSYPWIVRPELSPVMIIRMRMVAEDSPLSGDRADTNRCPPVRWNTRQESNLRALGSKPNGDTGNPRLVCWIRRQESDLRGLRSERSWDASNPHLNNCGGPTRSRTENNLAAS